MIAAERLRRDQFFEVDGVVLKMIRKANRHPDGAMSLYLEQPESGAIRALTEVEFEVGFAEGRILRVEDPIKALDADTKALLRADYGAVPVTMRREAERRHAYIRAYHAAGEPSRTRAGLGPMIDQTAGEIGDMSPPAWNTLSRWLALWERAGTGDVRILLPKYHKRGPDCSTLHPFLRDRLKDLIDEVYMNRSQNKAKHVHAALHREVVAWNGRHGPDGHLACPSLRTIQRHIEALDQRDRLLKRKGRKAADAVFKPVMKGPEPDGIMEVVEIDHTRLDLVVLADDTKVELGRPWITAAIDRHSRCIVGFHIGFESPSTVSLMLCLRHMMTPKAYVKQQYPDVRTEYPCWGVPDMVVNDNGPEFLGNSLKEAALQLGFRIEWAPVDCPEFKGKIERFFRTANEEVSHRVSGTVNPSIRKPGGAEAAGPACIPFGVLVARFHHWLLDVYHNQVHEGIGDVPIRRWLAAEARRPPRRPTSMKALDVLRIIDVATPVKKGIRWKNLWWNGPVVADIRALPSFKRGDKVRIRVDPLDVHTVQVIHPVTGEALEVGPIDPDFPHQITLFQWTRSCALKKARAHRAGGDETALAALDYLRRQADEHRAKGARIRLDRIARFAGVGMAPAGTTAPASTKPADGSDLPGPQPEPASDRETIADTPPTPRSWKKSTIRKTDPANRGGQTDGR
ncbi:transposase family protein [Azospirillum sp. RWY-5-1]|uniref:Transposase family protein n=1 Tax=Azospirillum oleiclasticum TaxID=2735135 RepID=A0ABX2TDQ5_9PROT|nr:DDE-type integrase/transposase/recombinase [Azospirillum oleiclasticum]NYZ14817.1 transposase family protein [Azospirillum oleiclasticum]NYZ22197.1 transposase family protein [Azospirillum oleiclasticum]